jgi:hypothetical protein
VRRELVPLALDAYPEAYEEFKRCMLVFVFGPEAHGSTVGELWAASTRAAVAAQLARTLRQAAGAARLSPPGLLMLLTGTAVLERLQQSLGHGHSLTSDRRRHCPCRVIRVADCSEMLRQLYSGIVGKLVERPVLESSETTEISEITEIAETVETT